MPTEDTELHGNGAVVTPEGVHPAEACSSASNAFLFCAFLWILWASCSPLDSLGGSRGTLACPGETFAGPVSAFAYRQRSFHYFSRASAFQ